MVDAGALLVLKGLVLNNQAFTGAWMAANLARGADAEPGNLGPNPGIICRAGSEVIAGSAARQCVAPASWRHGRRRWPGRRRLGVQHPGRDSSLGRPASSSVAVCCMAAVLRAPPPACS